MYLEEDIFVNYIIVDAKMSINTSIYHSLTNNSSWNLIKTHDVNPTIHLNLLSMNVIFVRLTSALDAER